MKEDFYKKRFFKEEFPEVTIPEESRAASKRDRDRILFSRAFRRLSFKTQVVVSYGKVTNDHIRSRLTHSLEVMQIAEAMTDHINKTLKIGVDNSCVAAIALGHDLGHSPYGHIGEQFFSKFLFGRKFKEKFKKIRHSFQSLKVCCFLEKHYKPDFYGLNLTISVLDGILKHSNLSDLDLKLYKLIFDAYINVFCNRPVNSCEIENIFKTNQPLTPEGLIVAIADEIAQLCHDIEDLRRIESFNYVKDFYKRLVQLCEEYLPNIELYRKKHVSNLYQRIKSLIEKSKDINQIERLYVKLLIILSFTLIEKIFLFVNDKSLEDIPVYLGKFTNLQEVSGLDNNAKKLATFFEELFKYYNKLLFDSPNVAKWDIKGNELIEELCEKLFSIFKIQNNEEPNLSIFPKEQQEDLLKSYEAGNYLINNEEFKKFLKQEGLYPDQNSNKKDENIIKDLPIKFIIWDYVAGMTDSYIIREFESITFKRVAFD